MLPKGSNIVRDFGPGVWCLSLYPLRIEDFSFCATDAIVNSDHAKVGCLVCKMFRNSEVVIWMAYTSWPNHLKSTGHINAEANRQQNRILAQATHDRYQQLYSSIPVSLQNPPPVSALRTLHEQFAPFFGEDINGVTASDFVFDETEQQAYFAVEQDQHSVQQQHDDLLRAEVQLLHLEALKEEFEGADDETIPALAEEFRNLGKHPSK